MLDLVNVLPGYVWAVLTSVFGIVGAVLTAVEILRISGVRGLDRIPEGLITPALIAMLFLGTAQVYHEQVQRADELQTRLEARAARATVRSQVTALLIEGQQLHARASDENQPVPEAEVADWIARLEAHLQTIDPSYVARSRNSSGLPIGALSTSKPPTPERMRAVGRLRTRLARLEEFLRELV